MNTRMVSEGVINSVVAFIFVVMVTGSFAVNLFDIGKPKLDVVATAVETQAGWIVQGKVLYQGNPVTSARVWSVVRDAQGNRFVPDTVTSQEPGSYKFRAFPKVIGGTNNKPVIDISVFATALVPVKKDGSTVNRKINGEEVLGLGGEGRTRWIQLSPTALIAIPTIFFVSLMIGLVRFESSPFWQKAQYFGSVALGIILTITMVGYISYGLYLVSVTASSGDALSLGFATIFQGTYVQGISPEWLFSLTAPGGSDKVVSGLGAPLWVLLLAVLGSGIYTVALIVSHIDASLDLNKPDSVQKKVQEIVKHQFYILFSPVGAVLVYQTLVVAGAASQAVTVGIAAIAAGIALNTILDKAIQEAKKRFA